MNKNKILTILVYIFIIVGFLIGSMNAAFSKSDNLALKETIHHIYILYENVFRTVIVVLSSYLTLSILKQKKKKIAMRKKNLIFTSIFMTISFIIVPILFGISELSIAFMPFPWSTMPIQFLHDGAFFSTAYSPLKVDILLTMYLLYQIVIVIGTIVYGRRFHCSMLCPYSGCHAESFALALPLVGKKRLSLSPFLHKVKNILKYSLFALNIFLILMMGLAFIAKQDIALLRQIEIVKYMVFDMLALQLFYFIYNGRGYCFYCPAGTSLGLISKLARQQISTDTPDACINCKLCDTICPMSLSISENIQKGLPITSMDCVGCGHCVDACPVNILTYKTRLISMDLRKLSKE